MLVAHKLDDQKICGPIPIIPVPLKLTGPLHKKLLAPQKGINEKVLAPILFLNGIMKDKSFHCKWLHIIYFNGAGDKAQNARSV